MSHPEASGTESSGDSDFVQVEVPDTTVTEPAPVAAAIGEVEMNPQAEAVPEPEPEPEPEPAVSSSSDSAQKVQEGAPEGTACCSFVAKLHPCIRDIIFWRNPIQSGVVFGSQLALLLLLRSSTVLAMATLMVLCMLIVAFTYRSFCAVVQTFQKRPLENPFQEYLAHPLTLPEDEVVSWAVCASHRVSNMATELRRLLTVQDVGHSVKFGVVLYIVYTISGIFSVWTLKLIGLILIFALPPVYEQYQAPIDQYLGIAQQQINGVIAKGRVLPVVGQFLPKEKTA